MADEFNNSRKEQIQFLRFFVFLHVYLFHASIYWNLLPTSMWNAGVCSVSFFFMLSGVLAGYKAYGRTVAISFSAVISDMGRRIRKFYPLHLITTFFTIYTTGVLWVLIHDIGNVGTHIVQLVRNLLLIHAWFPDGCLSYNGVSWFLSTLVFLNLLNLPVGALLNRIKEKKRANWIFVGVIAILFAVTARYQYIAYYMEDGFFLQYNFPPARIGEYIIAMIAGFMLRDWESRRREIKYSGIICTIAEVLTLVFWVYALYQLKGGWYGSQFFWILPNLCLLCVFMIGRGRVSAVFRGRFFAYLGDISFECYLIHQIIIMLVSLERPDFLYGKLVCTLFALLYTIMVSSCVHRGLKTEKKS